MEATTPASKPWSPPASAGAPAAPRKTDWGRALPFVGPVVLFIVWDLVVRLGFIKPILLPPPVDAIGALLGGLLGSNEKAYRSVEFLIDFFRSTPSSALIPLFLMIFGVSDINKVAIAAFGALLIVVFNSAYGVINARKQRVMAAKVMPIDSGEILFDGKSLKDTKIGYVFQNYREAMFPWMRTIDNIA